MSDITLKELRENFMTRDKNAFYDLKDRYSYGVGVTEEMQLRIDFTEQRVKDLCCVVVKLIEMLEEKEDMQSK